MEKAVVPISAFFKEDRESYRDPATRTIKVGQSFSEIKDMLVNMSAFREDHRIDLDSNFGKGVLHISGFHCARDKRFYGNKVLCFLFEEGAIVSIEKHYPYAEFRRCEHYGKG